MKITGEIKYLALAGLGALLAWIVYRAVAGLPGRWVNTPRNGTYTNRELAKIDQVTLHHTAGPPTQTAEQIANYHLSRGWPGIGYHYLIYPSGEVQQVNRWETVSYHNGVTNSRAIGISLVGNYDANKPSRAALASLDKLAKGLKRRLPGLRYLSGHKELGRPTACPGRFVDLDKIRQSAGLPAVPAGQALAGPVFSFTPLTGVAWDEDN